MTIRDDRGDRERAVPTGRAPDPGDAAVLRAVLGYVDGIFLVLDPGGRIRFSSRPLSELFPGPELPRPASFLNLLAPGQREEVRERLGSVTAKAAPLELALEVRLATSGRRTVHAAFTNLLDDPDINGILVRLRNAPERVPVPRDRAQELLDRVVAAAPVLLFVVDSDGVFQLSEGRALGGLDLDPAEAVGENVFERYADAPAGLALIRRALAGQEAEGETPLGDRVFHTLVAPLRDPDGRVSGVVGVSIDITEREREAERSSLQARLLDAVGQGVVATDAEGRVIYWNRAAEDIYGWNAEEARGREVHELVAPEPVSPDLPKDLGDPPARWTGEYRVRRKDGERLRIQVTGSSLRQDGEVRAVVCVATDLSERRRLEEQLRQAQKMEAVGRLAGGIAHDFNNLLTAIGGYAAMAAEQAGESQLVDDIAEVVNATARARELVDKLLAFSRRGEVAPTAINLSQLIDGMADMLRRVLGAEITLRTSLASDLWPVRVDPVQVEQVILNLAINAREAMPEGGTLTLQTDRVSLDAPAASRLPAGLEAGDYVRLLVTDDGTGIAPEIRERIFEPFFTTKEVGEGSGLGLSIAYGAIARFGGAMAVRSAPGEGTEIDVYLPRWTGDDRPYAWVPSRSATRRGGGERILLVEDEESVRTLARRVLERAGYSVLEAGSGVEAQQIIAGEERPPDLVLTDVIMPEMGGAELAEHLEHARPGLRILYMSGYTGNELASRGISQDEEHFLPKPFTPDELVEAVGRALRR